MNIKMNIKQISIALVVIFFIAIAIFAQTLIKIEQRSQMQDILHRGNYLVSLIALHPIKDFHGNRQNLFLKTLAEQISSDGLAYCFIHDQTGNPLVSFVSRDIASKIPPEVQTRSLYVNGLTQQTFKVRGTKHSINEFAKPIFEDGQRSGTVRLGFNLPTSTSPFSLHHTRLLAMIAFFIVATASLVYYGINLALRPLNAVNENFKKISMGTSPESTSLNKNGGITDIITDLEQSVVQLKEKYEKIRAENISLTTKCGVISFEKNNIFSILDSINYGIIVTDIQDNINYINNYMLKTINKERDDVVDSPLHESLNNNEIKSFILDQNNLMQNNGCNFVDITFPEIAPGEIFLISLSFLKDKKDSIIGKVISVRNITRERSAEKAKYEFIAHITHELLTPLTTINSYNEMLMDNELDNVELKKEFYNTISEETSRLTSLIKNLLSISKIEMGSLTIEKGLVKSDWLFNDCMAAVEGAAQKKDITIERKVPDSFPSLVGDKELLKVGIINILGNAVKYTPENGNITFTLVEQEDMVVFDVVDNGFGIAKEDLPHIFDKFYRSSDAHITDQAGSGLGLALTSEIIRLHGGEIEVQSKPGEGSHFMIRLPKEAYYLGKQ